jgi:hypothetical protein
VRDDGDDKCNAVNYLNMVAREETSASLSNLGKSWNHWRSTLKPAACSLSNRSRYQLIRIQYYHTDGHSLPGTAQCLRSNVNEGLVQQGPDSIITMPPTKERIVIDEALIGSCKAD